MKPLTKYTSIASVAVIFAIAGSVYYTINKPHRRIGQESPVCQSDAFSFFQEYKENEADGNKKYIGKAVEITGIIAEVIGTDNTDLTLVLSDEKGVSTIRCAMDADYQEERKGYHVGDRIRVKGKCAGISDFMPELAEVLLTHCVAMPN